MKSNRKILFASLTLVFLPLCLSNSPAPWTGPSSLDISSFVFSSSLVKTDLGDDGCYYSVKVKNSGSDYINTDYVNTVSFSLPSGSTSYDLTLDDSLYFPIIVPNAEVAYRSVTFAKGSAGYSLDITGATFKGPTYVMGYPASFLVSGLTFSSSLLTKKEIITTTSNDTSSSSSTKTEYYEKLDVTNNSTSTINSMIFVFTSSRGELAYYDTVNSISPNETTSVSGYDCLNSKADDSIVFSRAYYMARNSYYDHNHDISPTSKTWWWLFIPLYIGIGLLALQLIAVAIILPIMHSKNKKKSNS